MADDVGREAVTLERELAHRPDPRLNSPPGQPNLCDNANRRASYLIYYGKRLVGRHKDPWKVSSTVRFED